jgi:hypothetical protein
LLDTCGASFAALQHFVNENKHRSIFHKNVGRALLAAAKDLYAAEWEIDRTSRAARERYGPEREPEKRRVVEGDVTSYLQANFSFAVFEVPDKEERLMLDAGVKDDLDAVGLSRVPAVIVVARSVLPKERIRQSGLWECASREEVEALETRLNNEHRPEWTKEAKGPARAAPVCPPPRFFGAPPWRG